MCIRDSLYEMDYLQEGIGLRAMAQRDPLVEYQREGFQLFEAMMDGIKAVSYTHLDVYKRQRRRECRKERAFRVCLRTSTCTTSSTFGPSSGDGSMRAAT